jgi:periplasmic protein TonB
MAWLMPRSTSKSDFRSQSWFQRVAENLGIAFLHPKYVQTSSNDEPLHFSDIDLSARYGSAQTYSAIIHAALLCAMLLLLNSARGRVPPFHPVSGNLPRITLQLPHLVSATLFGKPSLGLRGGSGDNDPRPPKRGELAPRSSMPLAPPRLPQTPEVQLPVPPAVFDAKAPGNVPVVTNPGLPWMKDDTNSGGPGKRHGIGSGDGNGMGDSQGDGEGEGDGNSPYANVLSPVACRYYPEPPYTEEARKAKLQGHVIVEVLVGTDGRAQKIRIVKGLGLGLEEQTMDSIRGWRFAPAQDAHHKAIAVWVTIETAFRLF